MLVDRVKKREVQNWMKSVLAINKTAEVLRPAVQGKFKQFIASLPDVEKEHLEIFYQCLKKNDVVHFKYCSMKNNAKKSWECTHQLCQNLMKRLLDNFENGSQTRLWKFNITTPIGPVDEVDKSTQTTNEADGKWNLITLFMFGEMDKIPRTSLNDLDLSQAIKLMRSCTLFTDIDGSVPALEKALESRNQLMHSIDNEISNDDTSRIFGELTELVKLFADQQEHVVEDMNQLRDTDLIEKEKSSEYKDLVCKVLHIKQQALKLDMSVNQNLDESKTQSQDLIQMLNEATAETSVLDYEKTLDTSSEQSEELQNRIDATKQQHRKIKEDKERQQNQLKELETAVAKEQEIIDDIERRKKQMKEEEERRKNQLKELETSVEKEKENIDDINRRINQTKQQHEETKKEQERQKNKLKEIETTVVKEDGMTEDMNKRLNQYEKTIQTRSKQSEELQKRIDLTKQLHQTIKEEEESQNNQLMGLDTTVAKEKENIDDINRRINQTKQQHEETKKEQERQKNKLKEIETTVVKDQEVIDDIDSRLNKTKQIHQMMKEKKERQKKELMGLETAIAKERVIIDDMERRINQKVEHLKEIENKGKKNTKKESKEGSFLGYFDRKYKKK